MAVKSRLPNQFPRDQGFSAESLSTLDSMLVQLNTLLGQGSVPPGQGLGAFGPNIIDPTSAQVDTGGSRTSSFCTGIQAVMTTTTATVYWDGSNGSQPFKIYRDDGTVFGPFITDSGKQVTGLSPSTTYYFYPYWDETLQRIAFATVAGVSVGSPAIAFTSQNNLAVQQQILRNHIPLAFILSSTGAATTGAGTTTVFGGSGGGASGVGGTGRYGL
jgi:hypothetical protein